jgi:hypothetical protein
MTKEDDGTNQLMGELCGKPREGIELLPVVGRFEAWTGASRHPHPQRIALMRCTRMARREQYVESRQGMTEVRRGERKHVSTR